MYQKTITYHQLDGTEITDNFYFNLSKPELMNMMIDDFDGDPVEELTRIMNTKNTKAMIKFVETIIRRSYGEKSADGKRFVKSDELTKAFMETEAYEKFFMELFEDASGKAIADFITGIVPSDMRDAVNKAIADNSATDASSNVVALK